MELLYPVSKSHMAFIFAVERMFDLWPNQIYMWTFTFRDVPPDEVAMLRWKELTHDLRQKFPYVSGIRVVEVHPGSGVYNLSHGLHFHALLNRRIGVAEMRRLADKADFGRVHVIRVDKAGARYVGKYLTKGQPELQKGCRRWGAINWPSCNRVNDIKVESLFQKNVIEVMNVLKTNQLTPDIIHTIYQNTRYHGAWKNWSGIKEKYYYSERSRKAFEMEDWRAHLGANEEASTRGYLYPRRDKLTREQSMVNIATRWRLVAQAIAKRRNLPAAGEKNFGAPGIPRGDTGDSPVQKWGKQLDTSDYVLDKLPRKWAGMACA